MSSANCTYVFGKYNTWWKRIPVTLLTINIIIFLLVIVCMLESEKLSTITLHIALFYASYYMLYTGYYLKSDIYQKELELLEIQSSTSVLGREFIREIQEGCYPPGKEGE